MHRIALDVRCDWHERALLSTLDDSLSNATRALQLFKQRRFILHRDRDEDFDQDKFRQRLRRCGTHNAERSNLGDGILALILERTPPGLNKNEKGCDVADT